MCHSFFLSFFPSSFATESFSSLNSDVQSSWQQHKHAPTHADKHTLTWIQISVRLHSVFCFSTYNLFFKWRKYVSIRMQLSGVGKIWCVWPCWHQVKQLTDVYAIQSKHSKTISAKCILELKRNSNEKKCCL